MDREGNVSQAKVSKKLASKVRLKPICPGALQNGFWGSFSKLEHRAELWRYPEISGPLDVTNRLNPTKSKQ